MKNPILSLIVTAVAGLLVTLPSGFSQGSLTPPGAPAPTMKSLAQIEPRTPISSVPFTISTPGSYYLATDVTATVSNAIFINSSDVTLDLNGFTIFSTVSNAANGGAAILLGDALSDITIRDGHIRGGVTLSNSVYSGGGFGYGIYNASSYSPANILISHVTITGCLYDGINFNETYQPSTVESCIVQFVGGVGISAYTVINSTVWGGTLGIQASEVSGCNASSTSGSGGILANEAINSSGTAMTTGTGLSANEAINCSGAAYGSGNGLNAKVANNCTGQSSSGTGLSATYCATGCYGTSGSGYGLYAAAATGCYGFSTSLIGLYAMSAMNCVGVSTNGTGLYAPILAVGCYGTSTSGTGFSANLANSCIGTRNGAYSVSAINKYNMP